MAVNKVVMNTTSGEQTLIDLTDDTVTPETLAEGTSAHSANGERITGTMPTTTVLYTQQSLTTAQKMQARTNIGAAAQEDVEQLSSRIAAIGTQDEIVRRVVDILGASVYGVVDANNSIIFRGYLANSTYTLSYEDADGNIVDGGTITVSANETGGGSGGGSGGDDSGMGDSGTIELSWATGVKLDKNTGVESSGDGYAASQHIELVDGYEYTFNQLDNGYANVYGGANICYYDANGTGLGYELLWDAMSGVNSKVLTPIDGAKMFRVRLYCGSYNDLRFFSVTYSKKA